MSVWCNACGQLSQDHEFCDNCNADLETSGQPLPPERCPVVDAGVVLSAEQRRALTFPEAAAVVEADGLTWRVHWIANSDWTERGPILDKRVALQVSSLPPGRLVEDIDGRWAIFASAEAEPLPWNVTVPSDPFLDLRRLCNCVRSLANALDTLHEQELVWLRFDPSALEDIGPLNNSTDTLRRLRITNLDVELFPFRKMPERIRVHPHFAAPEVMQFRAEEIGPRTDVFHLAIFAYHWLARKLPDGLAGAGLQQFDFEIPFLRVFTPRLPIGILPAIRRGLSLAPAARHETPSHFAADLEVGLERASNREAFAGSLHWDIGGNTRTGRAKAANNRVNEDAILIKEADDGALVVVADGISTCDIGSGALASLMTTTLIENAFAAGCTHETFRDLVSAATKRGSEGLLEWAVAHGCKADLLAGKDLMGTTLTVGWLQGRQLSIANLGDSRAYLVTPEAIEQLTVDGDLASDLLAQGASPEEIRELGSMARALRECVGGSTTTPDGELSILPESAHPKTNRWPLLPEDIIVLCSDGLVEEGYFLEPRTVFDIVRKFKDESASELALRLVDAADAMQRLPTLLEPEGFGDNISCVVIKILGH